MSTTFMDGPAGRLWDAPEGQAAHHLGTSPLPPGTGFCYCAACWSALEREAKRKTTLTLAIRTGYGERLLVRASDVLEAKRLGRSIRSLLSQPEVDSPCAIWIASAPLPNGQRRVTNWFDPLPEETEPARSAKRSEPAPVRPFEEVVAPARTRWRERIAKVVQHALGHGVRIPPDEVALIVETKAQNLPTGEPLDFWTKSGVLDLLRSHVMNYCSLARTLVPPGVPISFWWYLDWLNLEGLLHNESDPIDDLRKPLRCYGGVGPTGRKRTDAERPDRCECFDEPDDLASSPPEPDRYPYYAWRERERPPWQMRRAERLSRPRRTGETYL